MIDVMVTWLEGMPWDTSLWTITLLFIIADVLFGTIKAALRKCLSSEKARLGILHKMGFICAMTLCTFIDAAQHVADLGFTIPVLPMCCVMIMIAEIMSLCEHVKDMNPCANLDFLEKKE